MDKFAHLDRELIIYGSVTITMSSRVTTRNGRSRAASQAQQTNEQSVAIASAQVQTRSVLRTRKMRRLRNSPKNEVSFSTFDMKNVHITGCKPAEIESMTATKDWKFQHVDPAIVTLLDQNPGTHLYLGGIATCYSGSSGEQAPTYAAFLLPAEFGAPTNSMLLVDNQVSEEQVIPFSNLGYRWKMSDDPRHNGRVSYLYLTHDASTIAEEEALRHEYATFCVVPQSELSRCQRGRLIVDRVRFEFIDRNNEEIPCMWYPREQTLWACITDLIESYYEDDIEAAGLSIEEEIPGIRVYLSQTIESALEAAREEKKAKLESFFTSVNYTEDGLNRIQVLMIYPLNWPNAIISKFPGRMLDGFWQQQPPEMRQIICNYHSLSATGLRHHIAPPTLRNFSLEDDLSRRLLNECLVVDLLFATNDLGSSMSSIDFFLSLLDEVISTFGLKRIAQFLGHPNPDGGVELGKQRYAAYFNDRINEVKQAIEMNGRPPSSTFDYLVNFTFTSPSQSPNQLYDLESIRLMDMPQMLQVRSAGEQTYHSISVCDLRNCLSELGTKHLLLQLLCTPPGRELRIPAGSRGDSGTVSLVNPNASEDEDKHEKYNCFKNVLLMSTIPSPSAKQRIRQSLPDHEVSMPEIRSKLNEAVKTIAVKRVKANVRETAMTGQSEMLGVFHDNRQHKHCVFINGKDGNGGSISDPVDGYGRGLERSDESLRQLGISEFCELYTLSRREYEMSDKMRTKLQKQMNLPFFEDP